MKRSLLISGATVGGLGAALVALHPSYGSENLQRSSIALSKVSSPSPISTTRPVAPKQKSKSKSKSKLNIKQTPKPKLTPVRKAVPVTPAVRKVSGTFTGDVVDVNYGLVQVQITVVGGKITEAQALQAPSGRSDRYTQYALPILRDQTLAAQSLNIEGATGASYTSYGWYTSLQSALLKAGL